MEEWTERQTGVGHPAGHHDVRTLFQRGHDRAHAEVGVGGEDLVANVAEGPAGVHVAQLVATSNELVEARQDIVPRNEADIHLAREPQLSSHREHRLGAATRVHASGVGGHPDALGHEGRENSLDQWNEVPRIARVRVT
jgi:hypothetical protein